MPSKLRARIVLFAVVCSGIGKIFEALVFRPTGQTHLFHYVLLQLWPHWVLGGVPGTVLAVYLMAPLFGSRFKELQRESLRLYEQRKLNNP